MMQRLRAIAERILDACNVPPGDIREQLTDQLTKAITQATEESGISEDVRDRLIIRVLEILEEFYSADLRANLKAEIVEALAQDRRNSNSIVQQELGAVRQRIEDSLHPKPD